MVQLKLRILNNSLRESCDDTLDDLELSCFSLGNSVHIITVSFHICCTKERKAAWDSLYTILLRMRTAPDVELTSEDPAILSVAGTSKNLVGPRNM